MLIQLLFASKDSGHRINKTLRENDEGNSTLKEGMRRKFSKVLYFQQGSQKEGNEQIQSVIRVHFHLYFLSKCRTTVCYLSDWPWAAYNSLVCARVCVSWCVWVCGESFSQPGGWQLMGAIWGRTHRQRSRWALRYAHLQRAADAPPALTPNGGLIKGWLCRHRLATQFH